LVGFGSSDRPSRATPWAVQHVWALELALYIMLSNAIYTTPGETVWEEVKDAMEKINTDAK